MRLRILFSTWLYYTHNWTNEKQVALVKRRVTRGFNLPHRLITDGVFDKGRVK